MSSINNPIKIEDISLENISNIHIKSDSEHLCFGRRFSLNGATEGVIFNDLFKTAQNLVWEASTVDELTLLKRFIGKLRQVETESIEEYENRDDLVYKFRTWFHRLFGQAFLGKHLERLDILEAKLDHKLHLWDFEPTEKTLSDHYVLFQNCLSTKVTLPSSKGPLSMGYNQREDYFYYIIEDNRLEIQLEAGRTSSIHYNGMSLTAIPQEFLNAQEFAEINRQALIEAYKKTSTYQESTTYLIKDSLMSIPIWHLLECCKQGKNHFRRIVFLESTGRQRGVDAGGLRQDYVSTLMQEIQNLPQLFHEVHGGQKLPCAKEVLTEEESQVYYSLGSVMKHCIHSGIITGRHFNDALFSMISTLSYDEVDSSIVEPSREVQVKMAKSLLQTIDKGTISPNMNLIQCLDLFDKIKLQDCLTNQSPRLYEAIYAGNLDYLLDSGDADTAKIQNNLDLFTEELYQSIFNNASLVDELNGASLRGVVSPAYRIGQGLAQSRHIWNSKIYHSDTAALNTRIQGVIDREAILLRLRNLSLPTIKFEWLKEWLGDSINGASDQELRMFLKFVTGANSLKSDNFISIRGGYSPYPVAHTCSKTIDISPNLGTQFHDGTKEGFLSCLKEAIISTGFELS